MKIGILLVVKSAECTSVHEHFECTDKSIVPFSFSIRKEELTRKTDKSLKVSFRTEDSLSESVEINPGILDQESH